MTVETAISEALSALVGSRVYADEAPSDALRPYIVYLQTGGDVLAYLDNTLADIENAKFQLTVWDDDRAGAKNLARQAEQALVAAQCFQAKPLTASVTVKNGAQYGARQDFSIWSAR